MRNKWRVLVLACLLLSGCAQTPKEMSYEEIAKAYVEAMDDNDQKKMSSLVTYDKTLQAQVDQGTLYDVLAKTMDQVGHIVEIHHVKKEEKRIVLSIAFEKAYQNVIFSFNDDKQLQGLFFQTYETGKLKEMPHTVKEESIPLPIDASRTLEGILTTPAAGDSKWPVVILLAGSGPNDKNETYGDNRPLQDIAWALAEQNIASYRYDKRTKTYPLDFTMNPHANLDTEICDDAYTAIDLMKTLPVIDADRIYVLGHSLGGYMIPRIAMNREDVAGVIMMAAPYRNLMEIIPEQIAYLAELDGVLDDADNAQIAAMKEQMLLALEPDKLPDSAQIMGMSKAYLMDFKQYDILQTAEAISQPMLVLQGERDYQVTPDEFERWKTAFSSKDNWQFVQLDRLNHLMMAFDGAPNPNEYAIPSTVDKRVTDAIAQFIHGNQ